MTDCDILIVGAGITAAAICSKLKSTHKIIVADIRDHIGGNVYDYKSGDCYIHRYGPHIFHSSNKDVVEYLKGYTDFIDYNHSVNVVYDGKMLPFPYSGDTEKVLGESWTDTQIIDRLFKPYSERMWGIPFDRLPSSIANRVPKRLEKSEYFPGQFVGIPKLGYTNMFEKMFDGVELILGVDENFWQSIKAKHIVYLGRVDHIMLNNTESIGDIHDFLSYRSLDITFIYEEWNSNTSTVNFSHKSIPYSRKTNSGMLYGVKSNISVYEAPRNARSTEINPFYPFPTLENIERHKRYKEIAKAKFPNIIFGGRIGNYKYIDMDQAFLSGLRLCDLIT
jgi:UDP-galactopyranose mutase